MSYDINVLTDGIIINGFVLAHPLTYKNISDVLGKATLFDNPNSKDLTYVWNDVGIRAFVNSDTDAVSDLAIYLAPNPNAKFTPEGIFTGQALIDGKPLASVVTIGPNTKGYVEMSHENIDFEIYVDQSQTLPITMLSIHSQLDAATQTTAPLVSMKAERPIQFADFNFKLAIIQELMFGEQPVLPPFSLDEFVDGYDQRNIDINDEGYDPIPEVITFFEEYEVDETYASSITSLYLDGGNQLYHEIAPLWGGDSPAFDIDDFSDLDHFPNLKEITNELFPLTDDLETQLKDKGVSIL